MKMILSFIVGMSLFICSWVGDALVWLCALIHILFNMKFNIFIFGTCCIQLA